MNTRVLVLKNTFVTRHTSPLAHAEECSAHLWLHSSRFSMPTPSVIRLVEYIHIPFERKSLSRKNILLRDHNTCQYCNKVLPPTELTLDHVIPRARGGDSSWDNLVACCRACNN